MHVASLELCKELYELSGWADTDSAWLWVEAHNDYELDNGDPLACSHHPIAACYLSYLMRKLPSLVDRSRFLVLSHVDVAQDGTGWVAGYTTNVDDIAKGKVTFKYDVVADTAEDALCQLAIKLFKQGILKREDSHE